MWTIAGATYEWNPDWFQGWAAMLQAVLSALAVWAAVWLQDRSVARRELAARNTQFNGIATVAVGVWGVFSELKERAILENTRPTNVRLSLRQAEFQAALHAMQGFALVEVGDVLLVQQIIAVRCALLDLCADIQAAVDLCRGSRSEYFSLTPIVTTHEEPVREACSSIERTVALYTKRVSVL